MSLCNILYFGGLGGTNPNGFDVKILDSLKAQGIITTYADSLDWRTDEPFTDVVDRLTAQASDLLKASGSLALVGASAGGSLALNVFANFKSKNVLAVSIAGRLHRGDLPFWDLRILERSTHLGTNTASQLCYDSISYFENTTLPALTKADKQRIAVIKPFIDFVVPRSTMDINGVEPFVMQRLGHRFGISAGLKLLPTFTIN